MVCSDDEHPVTRSAARCMVRLGLTCVRRMLCVQAYLSATGCRQGVLGQRTVTLSLQPHMRVYELGGWDLAIWRFWLSGRIAGPVGWRARDGWQFGEKKVWDLETRRWPGSGWNKGYKAGTY